MPASVRSRLFNPSYEDLRQELLESLARPGWPGRRAWLRSVSASRVLALIAACYRSSPAFGGTFSIEGRPEAAGPDEPRAQMRPATPGYFRTLAIPILGGRDFDEHDDAGATQVAIISEAAARRFWSWRAWPLARLARWPCRA
jgi:hypothetical protein